MIPDIGFPSSTKFILELEIKSIHESEEVMSLLILDA